MFGISGALDALHITTKAELKKQQQAAEQPQIKQQIRDQLIEAQQQLSKQISQQIYKQVSGNEAQYTAPLTGTPYTSPNTQHLDPNTHYYWYNSGTAVPSVPVPAVELPLTQTDDAFWTEIKEDPSRYSYLVMAYRRSIDELFILGYVVPKELGDKYTPAELSKIMDALVADLQAALYSDEFRTFKHYPGEMICLDHIPSGFIEQVLNGD